MRAGRKIVPEVDGVPEKEGPYVTRASDITVHQVCEKDGSVTYRKDRVAPRTPSMGSTYDWDAIERMNALDRGEKPKKAVNPELTDDADEVVFVPIARQEDKPKFYCEECGEPIRTGRSKRFCGVVCQGRAYARQYQARLRKKRKAAREAQEAKEANHANQ